MPQKDEGDLGFRRTAWVLKGLLFEHLMSDSPDWMTFRHDMRPKSRERADQILAFLYERKDKAEWVSRAEIQKELDIAPTSLQDLLGDLEEHEFIERNQKNARVVSYRVNLTRWHVATSPADRQVTYLAYALDVALEIANRSDSDAEKEFEDEMAKIKPRKRFGESEQVDPKVPISSLIDPESLTVKVRIGRPVMLRRMSLSRFPPWL
jgi:hypothetical protein